MAKRLETDTRAEELSSCGAEERRAEREQLISDLAFLVVCEHRSARQASSTLGRGEPEAK